MLREKPVRDLISETMKVLNRAVDLGIGSGKGDTTIARSLKESTFVFSGFKTFHEMKEAASLLVDENGDRKPFERYFNDVQKINSTYNKQYLSAEYDFTTASAEMAAKWDELSEDEDRYYLQYRTAGDNKVRKSHAILEGITLPASDPFWDEYYPPNGFRCRCSVTKVRRAKYEQSDPRQASESGGRATTGKHQEMFRFNPGKQKAAYPAYNSYTIKSCATCTKSKLKLARASRNELCAACRSIAEIKDWDEKARGPVKQADKEVKTWAGQFGEGKMFDSNRLHTSRLYISKGVAKRYLGHAHSPEAKWIIKVMTENPDNFTYKSYKALGSGKEMGNSKDLKNIDKKRKRDVTGYNYYDFEYMGKTWSVGMEVIRDNKYEQPYNIRLKTKKRT